MISSIFEAFRKARHVSVIILKSIPDCFSFCETIFSLPGRIRRKRSGCIKNDLQKFSSSIPSLNSSFHGKISETNNEELIINNFSLSGRLHFSFHSGFNAASISFELSEQRNKPVNIFSSILVFITTLPNLKKQ